MNKKTLLTTLFSILCYTLLAQTPLSGTYTIAATGGGFLSFNEAVDSLKANGISASVTFNVGAGTYDEFIEIDSIAGASESNQILFVGAGAGSTVLTVETDTLNPTISLNGASYIQFHDLTIAHEGHQDEQIDASINIFNHSNHILLKNCHITSGVNVWNHVKIDASQDIEIDSCQMYDNGFRNVMGSNSEQISITNSELIGDGMAFNAVKGLTLINNQLTYKRGREPAGGGTITSVGAFYMDGIADYYIERNIVNALGFTDALYIKNRTLDSVQHSILPTIINNAFLGDAGGTIGLTDSIKIVQNSFIGEVTGLGIQVTENIGDTSTFNFHIENNLFAGLEGVALYMSGPLDSNSVMDYNAYLIDTTALEPFIVLHPFHTIFGGAYSDMSLYQADFPYHDEHSLLIDVNYLATDDFHINSATEFHFGRNDLGIAEDVEGDPRGLWGDAVDVGADEFAGYLTNIFELRGRLFLDENGNGIQDDSEYGLANRVVNQLTDNISTLTDENGDYYFYTIDGNSYTISPEEVARLSISPTDSTVVAGASHIDSVNFAFQISEEIPEVEVDFTTAFKRCSSTINGYISYENTGSTQEDITIAFTPSESYTLESAEPNWDSEAGGAYYWDIENLNIFESGLIRLQITMPGVDALGVAQTNLLSAENADSTLVEKTYTDEIACAYDPNDKQVFPAGFGEDNLVLKETELEYLIRFQNTGNDTAFNVRIQDQLAADLDLSTFQLIAASHEVRTELNSTTNQLIFYFDDIQLVDSVANEPDSHGFVKYRIKATEGIADSTAILNTAYIYFDFNPPIITNTVSSMMVDELPEQPVTALPKFSAPNLLVYPNPTEGLLNIHLPSAKPVLLELISLDGRLIHSHHYERSTVRLELDLLPAGIYLLNVIGEGYQVQKKVVVE